MSFEIERNDSGTAVTLLGGHRFDLPAITDGDLNGYPIVIFHNALPLIGEALTKLKQIGGDGTLSPFGVEQKSDPVKAEMIGRVAAAAGQVKMFEGAVSNDERHLYALPEMDQGHTVAAIEDREIRDWWRSMSNQKRLNMLDQVQGDPAKHERLMIALLRAPAPLAMLDHETKLVSEVWKEAKRQGDPATAAKIELDRQHIEIARRGLGHLAGISNRVTGWQAERTLRSLITSPFEPVAHGFDIFGYTPTQVAGMRQRIDQEQAAGR